MEEQILSCYEALVGVSARMLGAARGNDLDGLAVAESECAALIARLRSLGDGPDLSTEGARRKMAIIRRVLADDAQIRDLTQPWLRKLELLIGGTAAHKKVHEAYGG